MATVERWLESLPEDMITHDAALALVKAWMCALYGRREESARLSGARREPPLRRTASRRNRLGRVGCGLVRGVFGYGGVRHGWSDPERRGVGVREDLAADRVGGLGLGLSLYYSGDTSGARRPFEEGLRLTRIDQPVLRIVMLSALSFVAGDEGHPEEAESLAREARR